MRIGVKRTAERPRLLRVTLGDIRTKREILGKAKLLKFSKFKDIYINPDLTADQREADGRLRAELKRRRNEGETNIYIKRGNIVRVNSDGGHHGMDKAPLMTENSTSGSESSSSESENESGIEDISMAPLESPSDDYESAGEADYTQNRKQNLENQETKAKDKGETVKSVSTVAENAPADQTEVIEESENSINVEKVTDSTENTNVIHENSEDVEKQPESGPGIKTRSKANAENTM